MTHDSSLTPGSPESDPADVAAAPTPSPGTLIRRARERARLTLDELAAQSKLARPTLEALEADAFGTTGLEPVYVRGYYRKCAKILNLSEDELTAAYDALAAPAVPKMPAKIRLSASEAGGGGGGAGRLLAIFFTLLVIGFVVFLWFGRSSNAVEAGIDAPLIPATIPVVPSVGPTVVPQPTVELSPAAEPVSEPSATPVATPAPSIAPAVTGELRVSLRITETSWVRINDADGRALVNGLMEPGGAQEIRGTAPLSVFLGNAPGVVLRMGEQSVDLRPLTNTGNNTARFTLPLTP